MGIIIRTPKETGRILPPGFAIAARNIAEQKGMSQHHAEVMLREGMENGHLSHEKQKQLAREGAEKEREKRRYERKR